MSNKHSSVEWFWNQIPEILPFTVDTETAVKLWEAFEQAKAMHKEEVIKFAEDWEKSSLDCKEDLYNETYGGNNE